MEQDKSFYLLNPRAWSLGTQLTVIITLLIIVTLSSLTLITVSTVRAALVDQIGAGFQTQSESLSSLIGAIFQEKLSQLKVVSAENVIKDALDERNAGYGGTEQEIRAKIRELDRAWIAADGDSPLIARTISSDEKVNPAANVLADLLLAFPDYAEIFLTDRYGATIAATQRLSDYDQSDEAWWQQTWNNGEGAVYISDPIFDTSAGLTAILIGLPVTGYNGEVAGVLRSTLVVDELFELVKEPKIGETGHAVLFFPSGEVLFDPRRDSDRGSAGLPASVRQHLVDRRAHHMIEEDQAGELVIFGHSQVRVRGTDALDETGSAAGQDRAGGGRESGQISAAGNFPAQVAAAVENLGWAAVIRQDASEGFESVNRVAQNMISFALLILIGAAVTALVVARTITRQLIAFGRAVDEIGSGNLNSPVPLATSREMTLLVRSFRRMRTQLREAFIQVEKQSRQRVQELEASAEISRYLASILDIDELLQQVVTTIRDTFGYYHVHVYLLDEANRELIMQEGTGEVGRQLKQQGHKLRIDQGIVGSVAGSGKGFLAPDVSQVPNFFRNPLLPKTQAELAIPLRKGNTILGVLDMQSEEIGGFSRGDLVLMQSIANQVAIVVDNARLFQQMQETLAEVEALNRRLTREAWHDIGDQVEATSYVFTELGITPSATEWLPAMSEAVQQRAVARHMTPGDGKEQRTSLAIPLTLRGEIIGVIGLERSTDGPWSEDERAIIQSATEQIALALESARLTRETARAAWRDRVVSESTAQVWASAEIDAVMRAAVAQLGDKLQASEVVIRLETEASQTDEEH